MSGLNFDSVGPFKDGLTNSERGRLAGYLTRACQKVPDAWPAARALGDPTNPTRRAEALQMLNAMGSTPRRQVIATFQRLSKD